jgi:RNA polymerase sigma-70 factor (ECF subfamily)
MAAAAIIEEAHLADADDTVLAQRLADGESDAFDRVVTLYQARVARLAHRLMGWGGDVEDVVQDVFLTVLRKSRSFRGQSSLWTWLTVITLNCCRRRLRRGTLLRRFLLSRRDSGAGAAPAADHAAVDGETNRCVRESVAALPAADREVIVLYYLEQRPVVEISGLLGVRTNAVHVRLHRARAKLSAALSHLVEE